MSLLDLITPLRPLSRAVARDDIAPKIAIAAIESENPASDSSNSNLEDGATRHRPPDWVLDDTPRRLWLVRDADGACWSVATCPHATFSEMNISRPGALAIYPEEETPPN